MNNRLIAIDPRVVAALEQKQRIKELNERFRPRWYGIMMDVQAELSAKKHAEDWDKRREEAMAEFDRKVEAGEL